MAALAPCPSCQWGDHDGHIAAWKPAPPGVLGGFYCNCQGDCVDTMGPMIEDLFKQFTKPVEEQEPTDLGDKWQMGCFIWDKEKSDDGSTEAE